MSEPGDESAVEVPAVPESAGPAGWPLEPDEARMRAMLDAVLDRIVAHVGSLAEQPAAATEGAEDLARSLRQELPETGRSLDELLELLFEVAVPCSFNTAGPGYLAYIPGGGLFESAVGSFIADAVNRYVGVFAAAPALAQLEANVVRWFAQIIGYPDSARGFLASGGSLATFSGLVTARRERLPENFLDGVIYVSDQAHHSIARAAMLAGFPDDNVRTLPSDDQFRLQPQTLVEAVQADRDAGRMPFLVAASAGTTNSGAIDPLEPIAQIAAEHGLWMHVDAAYGGFFMLTDRGRRAMVGLERADSVVLDPHKALFLPYGSGCLLVRDGDALRRAHAVHAEYMPPMQQAADLVDFCQISPELSRGFRGLKAWLPLSLHGFGPFRESLREKLELTDWITERLRRIDGVAIVVEPQLTVVAWRLELAGQDPAELDAMNRALMALINDRKNVYLTGTVLAGKFVIRICILSFRTHLDRMQLALQDIEAAIATMREEHAQDRDASTTAC